MAKFIVRGLMTVSCWTEVEANSAEEALEIASFREVAELSNNALYPAADEAWQFENDGSPDELRTEDETHG